MIDHCELCGQLGHSYRRVLVGQNQDSLERVANPLRMDGSVSTAVVACRECQQRHGVLIMSLQELRYQRWLDRVAVSNYIDKAQEF